MNFFKKHLKLIIFLLVCLAIFTIYKNNNKNNWNYTALGDSFVIGVDSYGRVDYGYSDYIKDELKNKDKLNKYIKSFSEKDLSIESLNDALLFNKRITLNNKTFNIRETLRESKLVTLSIGLNDLLYKLSITTEKTDYKLNQIIEEVSTSFNILIKEIRKYYPYDIYVIGYYNINPKDEYLKNAIQKLNNLYQNNKDIIFISTYELFENNSKYQSNPNSIYPNQSGYKAVANKVIDKIFKNEKLF